MRDGDDLDVMETFAEDNSEGEPTEKHTARAV
jgi:hypothetical protein